MTTLPQNIEVVFYKAINGDTSLKDFEQWLYADKEVEKYLPPNDYLDLISLDFQKHGARYELLKLLKNYLNLGEFETYKILNLLNEAKQKTERVPYVLMEFYDLYCDGYGFLHDLALGFGLCVVNPLNMSANTWEEITNEEQAKLLNSFSPALEDCIETVIVWLETKKIVLTGERDETGHYDYQDFRTDEEKVTKFWNAISSEKDKKWWQFWK